MLWRIIGFFLHEEIWICAEIEMQIKWPKCCPIFFIFHNKWSFQKVSELLK
jgi:hypothetical protein